MWLAFHDMWIYCSLQTEMIKCPRAVSEFLVGHGIDEAGVNLDVVLFSNR